MNLTVLVDNNTLIDRYFCGEPGLSFYIQDENIKLLFDVGYSDVFLRNAQKMDLDLLHLDYLVFSHGHLDHTWGLVPLINLYTEALIEQKSYQSPVVVAHPDTFCRKMIGEISQIGSIISEATITRQFQAKLRKEPLWLTERLVFLGEIERKYDFETRTPIGKKVKDGIVEDDFNIEDSALVYKMSKGLVIIVGCAHSGICNIVDFAKKICDDNRIVDIIGGFHLLETSEEQLKGTLDYMKKVNPCNLHACHCTDLDAKIALSRVARIREVGVGLALEYN